LKMIKFFFTEKSIKLYISFSFILKSKTYNYFSIVK